MTPLEASIEKFSNALAANPANNLARFSLAKALFDSNRLAEALPHLQTCVAAKPDWMVAHILLGKAQQALGHRQAAITSFHEARKLAETQHHEGPLMELEQMLSDLGEPPSA